MTSVCYEPDWPSVEAEFPPTIPPPRLLAQFVEFLQKLPDGSLGGFNIAGARLCDGAIAGGDDLAEHFGLFCHFGDGSQLGFWFSPEINAEIEQAPIVLFPHDDAPCLIAANLGDLLVRIASSDAEASQIPLDFQPDEDCADARPALRKWLHEFGQRRFDSSSNAQIAELSVAFDQFIEQAGAAYERAMQSDPLVHALAQILRPYWARWVDANAMFHRYSEPLLEQMGNMSEMIASVRATMAGQQIPEVDLLEVNVANGIVEITKLEQGERIAIPESSLAAPLILQLRQQQFKKSPERGLWHYASITLGEQGQVSLSRAQRAKPQFAWDSSHAVAVDSKNFPRSFWWRLED